VSRRTSSRKALEFEPELLRALGGRPHSMHRKRKKRLAMPLGAFSLAAAAVVAVGAFYNNSHADERAIIRTATLLLQGLRDNNLGKALTCFPESLEGARIFDADERRVLKQNAGDSTLSGRERIAAETARRKALEELRISLAGKGVDWLHIRPVAFGGMAAEVRDPALMREPADAYAGSLYFESGGRLYALEVSGRCCDGQCLITQVWRCVALEGTADSVEQHVEECYSDFRSECAGAADSIRVNRARKVFVAF
jgi:hypothetical protein